MANPVAQVPSETIEYTEIVFKWPLIGGATVAKTYQTGEMIGKRSDGYAGSFDDTAAMTFLGVLADTVPVKVDSGDADGAIIANIKRPYKLAMPLDSGTVSRVSNFGATIYASDSGHASLSAGSHANVIGNLVDVEGAGQPGALTGTVAVIQPMPSIGITGATGAITPTSITALADPLNILGLAGVTSTAGGKMLMRGGAGGTTGAGGEGAVAGGAGGSGTSTGGAATLTGGVGGATAGTGGAATVLAGAGTAGNAAGGVASVTGGAGNGSGAGGVASVTAGAAGATGTGGAATVTGGAATAGTGGAATIAAGAGGGTGAGGVAGITGGASGAGATGNGGVGKVVGGAALSTDGTGGAAQVTGGVGRGNGAGGAVTITSGASGGASGTAGVVTIDTGAATGGTGAGITIGGTNATFTKIGTGAEQAAMKAINVSGTVVVAVPTIADAESDEVAVSTAAMTFACAVGDAVLAIPLEALPTDCLFNGARVTNTDEVTLSFGTKEGGGGVTGANKNFKFVFIDLT